MKTMRTKTTIALFSGLFFFMGLMPPVWAFGPPTQAEIEEHAKKDRPWLKNREVPAENYVIKPSPQRLEAFQRLLSKFPPQEKEEKRVKISWNPRTGLPGLLRINQLPKPADQTPTEFVEAFFVEWQDLLGIYPSGLSLTKESRSGSYLGITYSQLHQGAPVFGRGVVVSLADWGALEIHSTYFPLIPISGQPSIGANEAIEVVARFEDVPFDTGLPKAKTELFIFPDCGFSPKYKACEFTLGWQVAILDPSLDTGYNVDAHTGKIFGEFPTVIR